MSEAKPPPPWAFILPFADAATAEVPLKRLLRLSLFQITVGLVAVLLIGTLNRVMIVELDVPASLVGIMLALPIMAAPFRALIGFKSDNHKSVLGWRRVPYMWMGTMVMFSGLAMMPFALILLSGDHQGPAWVGPASAAVAFLLCGAGMHTLQTVGLALATDLVPSDRHARIVALFSLMLLVGMLIGSLGFGAILADFSQIRLIQAIQGAALLSLILNLIALWKQEGRNPALTTGQSDVTFAESWAELRLLPGWTRRLVAIGLGSAGFAMQDILLEPYGGQILELSVGATTLLTALFAGGGIAGFAIAAKRLDRGGDAHRLAAFGGLIGIFGFGCVIFAAPLGSPGVFGIGTAVIGFGNGLFAVGTLTACMNVSAGRRQTGLALGVWGAVQATCAGLAIACGGILRDVVAGLAAEGAFGAALNGPVTGYATVYILEIILLFATLAAIGPLVRGTARRSAPNPTFSGLAGQPQT